MYMNKENDYLKLMGNAKVKIDCVNLKENGSKSVFEGFLKFFK